MRCECAECGIYMVHAEDLTMGCVCPNCKARCTACLGTNTLLGREDLKKLRDDPRFQVDFMDEDNMD